MAMRNGLILLIMPVVLLCSRESLAQTAHPDRVVMKDGKVVLGEIRTIIGEEEVHILSQEGRLLKIKIAEVTRIIRYREVKGIESWDTLRYSVSRLMASASIGGLFGYGKSGDANFKAGVSGSVVISYPYKPRFQPGIGFGLHYYRILEGYGDVSSTMTPIFVRVTGSLTDEDIRPVYYADLGYSFPWGHRNRVQEDRLYGGIMLGAGTGARFRLSYRHEIFALFGYQLQKSRYESPGKNGNMETDKRSVHRAVVRFGILFR